MSELSWREASEYEEAERVAIRVMGVIRFLGDCSDAGVTGSSSVS